MRVLVLNPGSSSLKSSVVESGAADRAAEARAAAADGTAGSGSAGTDGDLAPLGRLGVDWGVDATSGHDPADDLRGLLARYAAAGIAADSIRAVGYRVVHGGSRFREPTLVDEAVVAEVAELRRLAPLHNGIAAATMTAGLAAFPHLPQVAVFDTAFHATLPEQAYRYPVPEGWYRDWGVRRYGFHGLSVAWSTLRAAQLLGRPVAEVRLVVAHLGSGCSVTAVDGGRSVSTSMGLTPLEGLMMGTRAGSIDPGILFYVLREGWLSEDDLADELDHRSGLLGVSGRTSDVRDLLRLEDGGDERAALALTMFVRRAAEEIAAAVTSLPRLDAIVFTGGIGENAASVRARIVDRLAPLGVAPITADPVREDAILPGRAQPTDGALPVGARGGAGGGGGVVVLRIEAREDLVVAREAARVVEASEGRSATAVAGSEAHSE